MGNHSSQIATLPTEKPIKESTFSSSPKSQTKRSNSLTSSSGQAISAFSRRGLFSRKSSNTSSSHRKLSASSWKKSSDVIVQIMMPLYYTAEPIRNRDVLLAQDSWNLIMESTSSEWLTLGHTLPYESCRQWFEVAFYKRLFDIHPFSKKMFKDPNSQGKFLVALFSFMFTILEDEAKFQERLEELAESHCKRGVKACEYGIIGDVMFWTLRLTLGNVYDFKTHDAWVKIFSKMLKVIVPISISFELSSNTAQNERLKVFRCAAVSVKSDKNIQSIPDTLLQSPQEKSEKTPSGGCPFLNSSVDETNFQKMDIIDKITMIDSLRSARSGIVSSNIMSKHCTGLDPIAGTVMNSMISSRRTSSSRLCSL